MPDYSGLFSLDTAWPINIYRGGPVGLGDSDWSITVRLLLFTLKLDVALRLLLVIDSKEVISTWLALSLS